MAYRAHADVERAASMSAYMRGKFEFCGIPAPVRAELQRPLIMDVKDIELAFDIAEDLWDLEEREFQYTACDLLQRTIARKSSPVFEPEGLLERAQVLILSKPWWDTVDTLGPSVAGMIIHRSSAVNVQTVARTWIMHESMWVKRAAILFQLKYKQDTDAKLLFELVLAVASSTEFFLRKGAGWALREYSKTDPSAVRTFIDTNEHLLSPLTIREGSKYC